MKAGDADRLQAWFADPSLAVVDALTVGPLRRRLAARDESLVLRDAPHGTRVVLERPRSGATPRRVLELGRDGLALAILRWTDDDTLEQAWTRLVDDSWVMIEPRATREPLWGLCDRLWHRRPSSEGPVPLTTFEALAYERIDRIPALAEPSRLPEGAGTAVLNLVAALAADGGGAGLTYRGPYPTERLFLALLESFRYRTAEADPLAAFMAGRVEWDPAPHERVRLPSGVTAHLRERVEKVAWRGRLYHRPDWQGMQRHAHRRVRDAGDHVVCSLWALGNALEDHLQLDAAATEVRVLPAPPRASVTPRPLPAAIAPGLGSAVAALGAPPLAPFVRRIGAACELEWAVVEGDLVATEGTRLRVSHLLRDTLARRLEAAPTRAQRLALGLAALTELAHLLGDSLRALAQAHVATLPPDAQTQLLTAAPQPDTADAHRITQAIEALIVDFDGPPTGGGPSPAVGTDS